MMSRSIGPTFLVLACLLAAVACSTKKTSDGGQLQPGDFVSEQSRPVVTPSAQAATDQMQTQSAGTAAERADRVQSDGTAPSEQVHTVAAMIGQVNGQALYAAKVLQPYEADLEALGRRQPRSAFEREVNRIVEGRLKEIIFNALILGAAERDLSEREQAAVTNMLAEQREELLRLWGLGSTRAAEKQLQIRTGKGIDETLEDSRQSIVVRRYLQQKLYPKINVTRKDIGRYYANHPDEFHPLPRRAIRLISVSSDEVADRIEQALAAGQPFAEVARQPQNRRRPERGGLMEGDTAGNKVFNEPLLNDAMLALKSGEHSPRIKIADQYWWVHVESIEQAPARSLREAQLGIERTLRTQRYHMLETEYRRDLFTSGSYSPSTDQMVDVLVRVAMARYAAEE